MQLWITNLSVTGSPSLTPLPRKTSNTATYNCHHNAPTITGRPHNAIEAAKWAITVEGGVDSPTVTGSK